MDHVKHGDQDTITSNIPATTAIKPQARKLHDSAVTFEEYHYYALQTREEERNLPAPKTNWREILLRKKPAHEISTTTANDPHGHSNVEKHDLSTLNLAKKENRLEITDQEWTDASRAFRTASWGACFYLITTDVLGPYGVGFGFVLPSSNLVNVLSKTLVR
jgi:hypothetical protein